MNAPGRLLLPTLLAQGAAPAGPRAAQPLYRTAVGAMSEHAAWDPVSESGAALNTPTVFSKMEACMGSAFATVAGRIDADHDIARLTCTRPRG